MRYSWQVIQKNGYQPMTQGSDNPLDPGVLLPEAGESVCSPAAAPPGSGEVPAGEPNNEAPRTPPNDDIHCEIPFHPLANTFPMLDEESQLAMARDIRERGQFEAIVLYQEQILDGRCRYRACLSAEVVPKFEEYQGDDPLGYVVSRNIHRRHLLKDSQRALVAARLASLPVGANRYSEGVSIDAACKLLRVTPTAVNRAKKILRRGIPDVVKAVEDGSLTIWKALLLAKLRKSEQQAEMDRLAASESPVVEASNSPNLPAATEPSEGRWKPRTQTTRPARPKSTRLQQNSPRLARKCRAHRRRRQPCRARPSRAGGAFLTTIVMNGSGRATSRPRRSR
jgi:hypothetical protein